MESEAGNMADKASCEDDGCSLARRKMTTRDRILSRIKLHVEREAYHAEKLRKAHVLLETLDVSPTLAGIYEMFDEIL